MALGGDMTVFSCQFRLGPATKCPGGILDAYAAVNYITSNADKFNIDASKVGVYGVSGGGWIASGLAYELAKNNKSDLVKLIYLDVPQLFGDMWFNDDFEFSEVEKNHRPNMLGNFKLLTG